MAINKVVLNNEVQLDLTADTVDASHLATGYTAHNSAGELITGTMSGGGVELPSDMIANFNDFGNDSNSHGFLDYWLVENDERYKDISHNMNNRAQLYSFYQSAPANASVPETLTLTLSNNITGTIYYFFENANCSTVTKLRVPYNSEANAVNLNLKEFLYNCVNLEHLPVDYFSDWQVKKCGEISGGMFYNCIRLRNLPNPLIKAETASKNNYYRFCAICLSLDEAQNIPIHMLVENTNGFNQAFSSCYRLKALTFETITKAQWSGQIIDLTCTGYGSSSYFNTEKKITDDTTYQALKNDPDNWTANVAYSRYNKTSAIETINSLPNCSAYISANSSRTNNTIKFKGDSGSLTDGGAINTMTEEEIAVATAKGWTVTFS